LGERAIEIFGGLVPKALHPLFAPMDSSRIITVKKSRYILAKSQIMVRIFPTTPFIYFKPAVNEKFMVGIK